MVLPTPAKTAGYSGRVTEIGWERSDSDSPDWGYIIVEEAPGKRVKHYLPPSTEGILEGNRVVKEPGYGGRVYSPEYEGLMVQLKEAEARRDR